MKTAKAELKTTMVGSLPHHNIDAALEIAFRVDVPFLPQIPIRNAWEYMIPQALEGLPGLTVEKDGWAVLDVDVWAGRAHALNERLLNAFSTMAVRADAFEAFEPSAATSSSWQPFLWELQERKAALAKVQIAGPLTAQWSLKLSDGSNVARHPEIPAQIFKLVLARALAMARRLQRDGVRPILYLDEPGLYGFNRNDPHQALALRELKLVIQALKKEGITVGLHCCSNTDWTAVLGLELDLLSLDTTLSLDSLLEQGDALEGYVKSGGRLSLGVIPTSTRLSELGSDALDPKHILARLLDQFGTSSWHKKPELIRQTLGQALFTPACGLALHSTSDAEAVVSALVEFGAFARSSLA